MNSKRFLNQSPDFGDQLLNPMAHLSIYVVGQIISHASGVLNVPEQDLVTFLQVIWPPLFLRNDDGKIAFLNHLRRELLPFFFSDIYTELSSNVFDGSLA